MATIDDILRRKNNSGPQSAPKGSKEWAEQNSGVDVQPVVAPRPNPKQSETVSPSVPQTNKQNSPSKEDTEGAITRMYNTLFATPEQTPEQRAEEEKKQKRKMIINAIGDGISAISNMYFASKGAPSMYSPANSLSARSKERFDRLNKEREDNKQNFYNGWVKAQQIDRSIFENDREHNRKVKNDEDSRAYRAERDEIADERYKEQKEYEKHRDEVEDNRWQQNFDANKEKAENAHNLATTKETNRHNEKVSSSTSSSSSKARGKDWVFSDTNGNEVRIYDNVWQKSMQQVYDVLDRKSVV